MKILAITTIFIGNLIATSYRSVPEATDDTPFNTSTGERTSVSGVAISQDRLCGACRKLHKRCAHPEYDKKIHYGDTLFIEDVGMRIANDCMGKYQHYRVNTRNGSRVIQTKQLNWLDIWLPTYKDEHEFHKKYGIKQHRVWKVIGELK